MAYTYKHLTPDERVELATSHARAVERKILELEIKLATVEGDKDQEKDVKAAIARLRKQAVVADREVFRHRPKEKPGKQSTRRAATGAG